MKVCCVSFVLAFSCGLAKSCKLMMLAQAHRLEHSNMKTFEITAVHRSKRLDEVYRFVLDHKELNQTQC